MTQAKRLVNSIKKALEKHGIQYEAIDSALSYGMAPTATILTEWCTIEVYRGHVEINDKPVNSIAELMQMVLDVENAA